ncbi:MAG: restriction endonuclease [Candidatus Bathyarchaeia archaeon]
MLEIFKKLLELSYKNKEVRIDYVLKGLKNDLKEILEVFKKDGLIEDYNEQEGILKVNFENRLKMAIKAIQIGGDIEGICKKLDWQEFENFVSKILEMNGYNVTKHYRFKYKNKKYEFDILAYNNLFILCIDCKHWRHGGQKSKLLKAARMQLNRVIAFSKLKGEAKLIKNGKKLRLLPIVLTLMDAPFKELEKIPIVPILKFNDFMYRLSPITNEFIKIIIEH